jgi:UDP-glucose:(heptosyl)LPS alpha-1,3-glucosyltransferase
MEAAGQRGAGRGPYHRAILWLERRMFAPEGHRRVLAVSHMAGREVAQDYQVPESRIAVVYNGVDVERFNPGRRPELGPALREELGIAADVPLCAAIGSGFVRKGFDLLLTLWRRSPPARAVLLLVGDDERLLQWRRQVDDPAFAGRVLVTGPRSDVEAVLAAADVVCVPSRQEAFGNVVLEACAAGVPVVTSRRTGAAELLDGDLARLVIDDAESLDALAAALEEALGSDRGRFGAEGRRLAEALPWDLHLDHVEALLEETARGR